MEATPAQISRLQSDLSKMAGESVDVRQLSGAYYAFGSELATLRLFAKYNSNGSIHNQKVRCGYSQNLKSHYFVIET